MHMSRLANILKNNNYNYSGFIDNNSLLHNQRVLKKIYTQIILENL